jgi:hypothetical protein
MWNDNLHITNIPVKRFRRILKLDPVVCDCCSKIVYPENPTDRIFQWLCYEATPDDPTIKQLFCEKCLEHFRVNTCPHLVRDAKVTAYSRFEYDRDQCYPLDQRVKLSDEERRDAIIRFFGPDPPPRQKFLLTKRDRDNDGKNDVDQHKKNCTNPDKDTDVEFST